MCEEPKLFIITTVAKSLCFFKGQLGLWKNGFDVYAVSSEYDILREFAEDEGVRFRYLPMKREISIFSDVRALLQLITLFVCKKPMVVHANTPKASLLSMLAAWLTCRPVRIYMCHGLRYQGCSGFKASVLKMMEKITCFCATDIICVSHGLKSVLLEEHITRKEPIVIGNGSVCGIDPNYFNPSLDFQTDRLKCELGIKDGDYVLGFVGRIVEDKGINELVHAFLNLSKQYDHLRLLLVGELEHVGNSISPDVSQIIQNSERIILAGYQSDIRPYLSIMDVFIFPTYREGFGLSLIEAAAMSIPCIASNVIGCSEILINNETGILIDSKSAPAIEEAVQLLLTNKKLYVDIKINCRNSVIERYEQKTLWNKYYNFYLSKLPKHNTYVENT